MGIERYTLDEVSVILQAYNVPGKPYASRKNMTADIYFRVVPTPHSIDLTLDTLDYVRHAILTRRQLAADRKVAFLFQLSDNVFALIVSYNNLFIDGLQQIMEQANWKPEPPTLLEMRQSVFASQFKAIYESIRLDCVMPVNRFDVFADWPQSLRLRMKIHTTAENSGVTLTESILMLLFRNQLFPIELEQAFANQRRRCEQQFMNWLEGLKKSNYRPYQEIIRLLSIVVKFSLLAAEQAILLKRTDRHDILVNNQKLKKRIFALSLDDSVDILPHLLVTDMCRLLRLRHNPSELIRQLEQQRCTQEQGLLAVEQYMSQHAQPLSWRQWLAQSIVHVPTYCYERSYPSLFSQLVPWIMQQITPTCFANQLETLLQKLTRLIARFFQFIPENNRFLGLQQFMHQNKLTAVNACVGGGLGILWMYYSGIIELSFSLGLLCATEFLHDFLITEKIDLASASVIPRVRFVPSLTTLLRLNLLLLSVLCGLYTRNSDHLTRAGTAIGISELVSRAFAKCAHDLKLTDKEYRYCEFILTQCSLQFGNFFFSTYAAIRDKRTERDNTMAELTHFAKRFNGHVEVPNVLLQPWRWFNNDNPFNFFWRDRGRYYGAECMIGPDQGSSSPINVTCHVIENRTISPLRLTRSH